MKLLVVICLVMMTVSAQRVSAQTDTDAPGVTGSFAQAWRVGNKQRAFFRFYTTMGKYTVRHDGLGEVASRRIGTLFHLKLGIAGRIERVFSYEHDKDLVLLYEVSDGDSSVAHVVRLDQQTRKTRWIKSIDPKVIGPCPVDGGIAYCGPADDFTKIDLRTGQVTK